MDNEKSWDQWVKDVNAEMMKGFSLEEAKERARNLQAN